MSPLHSEPVGDSPVEHSTLNFPVVGIGASAGGLEALIRLFENLPARSGMAFVVILHLSPKHESSAHEILQRGTAMPVAQVTKAMPIEANHVYVIPPGMDLTMADNHVQPAERVASRVRPAAIDLFFRTLAQAHRERAICIVLSGTGSDGAVGLSSVKEHGGVTLAQLPEDAAYDGMPRAAVATGRVDIVLPAVDMGQCLMDLWANAQRISLPDGEPDGEPDSPLPDAAPGAMAAQAAEEALQEIMALLRSYTRHDFRHYKRATVLRRIERRLQVNRLGSLPAYRDFLQAHPNEAAPLLQDILISVTNFFRDRDSFESLERDVLPQLVAQAAQGDQLRVWVPGCATGEEAYSLSMLLREQADTQGKRLDIQIFATDIDERAIATARRGVYPAGIAEDLAPARLNRFFVREHDEFRVEPTVRDPVLFAVHNLLRDPPFSRLDLICCRNLLIYFDLTAQTHVLEMFRLALKPSGFLFLGASESTDACGNLFIATDKKHRIYRVDPGRSASRRLPLIHDVAPLQRLLGAAPRAGKQAKQAERASFAQMHQRALETLAPPSVLIDHDLTVLHLSSGVGRFLERSGGEPSDNLLSNVRPDLRLELRTALFKARKTTDTVVTRLPQQGEAGSASTLTISIQQVPQDEAEPLMLVVFEEGPASAQTEVNPSPDPDHLLVIDRLKEEIAQLKLHLHDTIESSEMANDDLKASNEELQAINEELRSATEELETSKEELQSMNEELVTVNLELKMKVEERGHINDDLQNLITSSEIATVFVDRNMRIKRYTPYASRLFNLIPSDLGRSLFDITSQLTYPELSMDTESAFRDLRTVERHVPGTEGREFLSRILPYRTAEDKIEGAILNFFDISELRLAEQRVQASEARLRLAAASTRDFAIITTDDNGLVATWNVGAQGMFGYSEAEMLGRPIQTIFTPEDQAHGVPEEEMRLAREEGRAEDERWHMRKDGGRFYASGVMTPLLGLAESGFAKIARDMTGTKQQELAQEHMLSREKRASLTAQTANELKDKFLAVMSHELKQPLNLILMNAELLMRLPAVEKQPAIPRIAGTIKRAIKSQTRIINDLLDLSRVRTGKLRLDRVAVDLVGVVRELASAVTAHLPEPRITIEISAVKEELVCIGDRVRVEQIVWNLLSNAVKFTPGDGRIRVDLAAEGDFARLCVVDSGCGIDADTLPHVFGMFNQAHLDFTPPNGGLGIGLALVHELTAAHGGRAEVASEGPGLGASFTVWLPLSGAKSPVALENGEQAIDLAGWRILAVDDYLDGLLPFADVLRLEGATVDVAQDASAALELLANQSYDLLVSDLGMPDIDGYELIKRVRSTRGMHALKAIAMSGFGQRLDARKALEAGFNAHVPKPASVEEIKAALAKL